ncbi:MAG: aminoacyltransferase [Candidatus Cloacimonetes bacterium]|nr:aminoacyltransferase [Candidatus Cloacimonadota bacterium]
MGNENLHVVELKPEQYNNWDIFVEASPQGDVFCYSWWLNAITKSNFKIIAILNCNEIQAGIPLAFDLNGKINEPPLTRTLGPLFMNVENISEYRKIMLHRKWLSLLLENINIDDVIQFCTHQSFTDWLQFRWHGFKQMTRYTYLIENNGDKKDLWINLSGEKKRVIKKAKSNGLYVEISDNLKSFYHLVELTYERQGIKFRFSLSDFERLDNEIAGRDKRRIFLVYDKNGNLHAGLYVVFNHKSAYYLLCGSDPNFRHLDGNTLAFWEAMNYFHDKVNFSNFGGSDIKRIEKYLSGFGGKLTQYFHIFTEQPKIVEVIKEVPVIKEIPVQTAPKPNDSWKYHFYHFMHHSYSLFDILRKKVTGKKK